MLAQYNAHPRDALVSFEETGHKYTILGEDSARFVSVTTLVKRMFAEFDAVAVITRMMSGPSWKPGHKYFGKTMEQIMAEWRNNDAALRGTLLHAQIERFYNNTECPYPCTHRELYAFVLREQQLQQLQPLAAAAATLPLPAATTTATTTTTTTTLPTQEVVSEWQYFLNFVRDTPWLQPYRTEWRVFDPTTCIVGSIDMVFLDSRDNSMWIYDWKRVKEIAQINRYARNKCCLHPSLPHIPDVNFWHYALQLNTYRTVLQTPAYGFAIRGLRLVQLHPDMHDYILHDVPLMHDEMTCVFHYRSEEVVQDTATARNSEGDAEGRQLQLLQSMEFIKMDI